MSAKSSGGVLGTLALVALATWCFMDRRQRQEERVDEIRNRFLAPLSRPKRSPSKDEMLMAKEHLDSIRKTAERGDLAGAFAVFTNVPSGASATWKERMKCWAGLIQRFNAFVSEFDARAAAEGLDLDLMLSPHFVCGVDGFESSLRRVDAAIGFMNELEDKMTGFLKEKDALLLGKTDAANPFNLTPQWKRITDSMTLMFKGGRIEASLIRELVLLHRDHPQDWKLDGGEVLYYDANLCDQVNFVRAKLLTLSEGQLRLENIISATQKESLDKLGKAFDNAVSR